MYDPSLTGKNAVTFGNSIPQGEGVDIWEIILLADISPIENRAIGMNIIANHTGNNKKSVLYGEYLMKFPCTRDKNILT
jgi:hypothetical protein